MDEAVFPTCVGVFQTWLNRSKKVYSLPHVRGGVSRPELSQRNLYGSSPRAWGCFYHGCSQQRLSDVFPTCVGVFLIIQYFILHEDRLPHVRGGVSTLPALLVVLGESSPRAWGCFWRSGLPVVDSFVFPTCVGVFLFPRLLLSLLLGLPHVRGGVSSPGAGIWTLTRSSPRAWGCFWCIQYCP